VAIVWPCGLSVDAYVAAGRDVEVPRPECSLCTSPMQFWSWYRRDVRVAGMSVKVLIRRARCVGCRVTSALLPSFVIARRLDAAESIGAVISEVVSGRSGVRPAAAAGGVVHETAREWIRRFRARAEDLSVAFAALVVELGGEASDRVERADRDALSAMKAAFGRAGELRGWAPVGLWGFASSVTGGSVLSPNRDSPYLVVGRRRFMAPVAPTTDKNGDGHGP